MAGRDWNMVYVKIATLEKMNQGLGRPMLFRSMKVEDSLKLYTSVMDWLRTYQDKF